MPEVLVRMKILTHVPILNLEWINTFQFLMGLYCLWAVMISKTDIVRWKLHPFLFQNVLTCESSLRVS